MAPRVPADNSPERPASAYGTGIRDGAATNAGWIGYDAMCQNDWPLRA
jgi:hypothetical protein